jgi:hypothetical protein
MKLLRLLLGTHLSKKHFMLEDANTLLLAHNCRTAAAATGATAVLKHSGLRAFCCAQPVVYQQQWPDVLRLQGPFLKRRAMLLLTRVVSMYLKCVSCLGCSGCHKSGA